MADIALANIYLPVEVPLAVNFGPSTTTKDPVMLRAFGDLLNRAADIIEQKAGA